MENETQENPVLINSPLQNKFINKKIVISVVLFIILIIGIIFYIKMSKDSSPQNKTAENLLPYAEIKSLTETDYNTYLSQKISGFNLGGLSQDLGFGLIRFWDNSRTPLVLGDFGLEIRTVPIPNIVDFKNFDSISYKITGVFDQNNKNIGEVDDKFQGIINTKYLEYPSPNILAFASGNLKEGTLKDIKRIEGVLQLKLPINAEKVVLSASDVGVNKSIGIFDVLIKSIKKKHIEISIINKSDQNEPFLISNSVKYYNKDGDELQSQSLSSNGEDYSIDFNDNVDTIVVTSAESYIKKEYNFVLNSHEETPVVVSTKKINLSAEQNQIKDAFSNFAKIINSSDTVAFRAYVNSVTPLSDEENKISDEDLKKIMGMIKSFSIGDITADDFSGSNNIWKIEADKASVTIKKQGEYGDTSTSTFDFKKVNNTWYQITE